MYPLSTLLIFKREPGFRCSSGSGVAASFDLGKPLKFSYPFYGCVCMCMRVCVCWSTPYPSGRCSSPERKLHPVISEISIRHLRLINHIARSPGGEAARPPDCINAAETTSPSPCVSLCRGCINNNNREFKSSNLMATPDWLDWCRYIHNCCSFNSII